MKFTGTKNYVATDDLKVAVNALHRARASAADQRRARHRQNRSAGRGSTPRRSAARRFCPGTASPPPRRSRAWRNSMRCRGCATASSAISGFPTSAITSSAGKLWEAFTHDKRPGAADRGNRQGRHRISQRPAARTRGRNGVLRLRDRREHQGQAAHRSLMITSNNEKELPDAFLRRCASSTTSSFPTSTP